MLVTLALAFCAGIARGEDYGLPANVQDGNILHCFNWTASQIKSDLPQIAAAGFGTVQMSPMQRPDIRIGSSWHDLYRPYDLAFKSSGFCSEEELKSLCQEAAEYGIKIIVDVVANHVDRTAGYHDTWWDTNGRVRWDGGINYGNRYSITHGQLGDYGDINSEDAAVIAKGKAYVEKLKSLGVKGCRWDAAKHIGLPSEGCNFWKEVTSVGGMYHYGEILDTPGPDPSIIKEYATYMSVTDNRYSNYAAQSNGGIPGGFGGDWVAVQGLSDSKLVYWGESHDTYSNDEWSQNVDQSVIDRAYAAYACRNGATALYLARPSAVGFGNIKVGKGSTAYRNKHIAEVNKFRNAMTGKKDWFESNGNACSITRQNGGAVVVMKGSGNVSIANGGGYCPAGTYKDHVAGGTFTVTASTISGPVGSSGIAVLYNEEENPEPTPEPTPDPTPEPDPESTITIYFDNTLSEWAQPYIYYWPEESPAWPGVVMAKVADNVWKYTCPAGTTCLLFNAGDGDKTKTGDMVAVNNHIYSVSGDKGEYTEGEEPEPESEVAIYFDNGQSGWTTPHIYYWPTESPAWPGVAMTEVADNIWKYICPAGTTGILFNAGDGDNTKTGDMVAVNNHIYTTSGDQGEYQDVENPDPTPDPVVSVPEHLYILGNIDGAQWATNAGVEMTRDGNSFVAQHVKFALNVPSQTMVYFNLTDALEADWDALNMIANRYGAVEEGVTLVSGNPAEMMEYKNNVSASGCLSWAMEAGIYTVTADFDTMTVTVEKESSAIDFIEADDASATPVYYNLQGVKIVKPTSGLYIVRRGATITREFIR